MSSRVVSVKLLLDAVAATLHDHNDMFENGIKMIKMKQRSFHWPFGGEFTAGAIDTNCVALVEELALFFTNDLTRHWQNFSVNKQSKDDVSVTILKVVCTSITAFCWCKIIINNAHILNNVGNFTMLAASMCIQFDSHLTHPFGALWPDLISLVRGISLFTCFSVLQR